LLQSRSIERHRHIAELQLAVGQGEEAPLQLKVAIDDRGCRSTPNTQIATHLGVQSAAANENAIRRFNIEMQVDDHRLFSRLDSRPPRSGLPE